MSTEDDVYTKDVTDYENETVIGVPMNEVLGPHNGDNFLYKNNTTRTSHWGHFYIASSGLCLKTYTVCT